ncbi:4'-phosphopantetheinyl transferase family protein [Gottfriedia luciferensis]|uniref:4'-phosphopantetheinyl transferase family protein n=1 Tax=Gottfriedia luciferensis TaxID=178774 RepID=UPI000B4467B2|nr:4'-phosphopantetheinyl transferase superfamily protein [Gottfriedia luciferensis]
MTDLYIFTDWIPFLDLVELPNLTEREEKWLIKYGNGFQSKLSYQLVKYVLGDVEIERDDKGKPYLRNDVRSINWSHTKGAWVLAVSKNGRIGVDIEQTILDYDHSLYGWVLHKEEKAHLLNGTPFSHVWTKKEAYLKYKGTGLDEDIAYINSFAVNSICTIQVGEFIISVCTNEETMICLHQFDTTVKL